MFHLVIFFILFLKYLEIGVYIYFNQLQINMYLRQMISGEYCFNFVPFVLILIPKLTVFSCYFFNVLKNTCNIIKKTIFTG